MNKKLTRILLLAAGLGLASSQALQARPPMGGPDCDGRGPHGHGMMEAFDADHLPPFLKSVKLSDEQRSKIGEILKAQGPAMKERFRAGRDSHDALRKLAFSSDYSDEKAKALSEVGVKAMAEAAQAHAHIDHDIYQVLTPEQQQQVRNWVESRDARRPAPK
jgi:periplasmic protein CpxP/Spy